MKVARLLLALLAALGAPLAAQAAPAAPPAPQSLTFDIPGMACAACAGKIKAALKAQPGLTVQSINLKDKRALVTLDPAKTDRAKIAAALAAAGFPAAPPPARSSP